MLTKARVSCHLLCLHKLVNFEVRYSNVKNWQRKNFLIFGDGWKYPYLEARAAEFLVLTNWEVVLENATIKRNLSLREHDHIGMVYS